MAEENKEEIFKDNPFEDTSDCKTGRGGLDDYRFNDDYIFDEEEVRRMENFKSIEEMYNYKPKQRAPRFFHPNSLKMLIGHLEQTVYENDIVLEKLRSKLKSLNDLYDKVLFRFMEFDPDPRPYGFIEPPDRIVNLLSREEWGAKPAISPNDISPLTLPVEKISITFNTKTKPCYTQDECTRVVKDLQTSHMEKGLPDVAHNFLVGEDGHVYEGRGWRLSPHIESYKEKCKEGTLDIAFIGGWTNLQYPYDLYDHTLALIDRGVDMNMVADVHRIYDFNDDRLREWDPSSGGLPFNVPKDMHPFGDHDEDRVTFPE